MEKNLKENNVEKEKALPANNIYNLVNDPVDNEPSIRLNWGNATHPNPLMFSMGRSGKKLNYKKIAIAVALAIALLVTLIVLFVRKEESHGRLSAVAEMVKATQEESDSLRKESIRLIHDLHLCQNNSHAALMQFLDKDRTIASVAEEKRQFQSTIESLERQLAAKDAEIKQLQKNSEATIFEKNSEVKLLRQDRAKLQYDFQSCQSNQHATALLLRNKTADVVSLKLEKMALADKVNILESQLTQNAAKEIASLQQHLGSKQNTSAKLQTCLAELLQERNNNSLNLLACSNNQKTENLLQEQAGQNEVLHLKIQSLQQQVESLKAVVLKTTPATPIVEDVKAAVVKATVATPIEEDLIAVVLKTTQVPPMDDLSTTDVLPTNVSMTASVMGYFTSFGRLFSAGTSVLPSFYTLSLNLCLILGMKLLL